MRQLKFRYLWKGDWHYIDLRNDNTKAKFEAFECVNKTTPLEQFTGLKDKNSQEVFEGDLIKYDSFAMSDKCSFKGKIIEVTIPDIYLRRNGMQNLEVIGNIHQNPELLKVNKK